ncbi:MAG: hypothetical protein HOP11_10835 [Saprospiraceae bacterium]|nr:hypothetical protein [Saprospiraceae bacterium]
MNKYIIVILVLNIQLGNAQEADRQLISSAGESATLNNFIFDWSLGEVVIDQFNPMFLQGFQQGLLGDKIIIIDKKNINYNTIITPGDGSKNETLIFDDISEPVELNIYDKWGNMLYHHNNYKNDWDGRSTKGIEIPDGVYIFILKSSNGELLKKGTVTIKRK